MRSDNLRTSCRVCVCACVGSIFRLRLSKWVFVSKIEVPPRCGRCLSCFWKVRIYGPLFCSFAGDVVYVRAGASSLFDTHQIGIAAAALGR